MAQAIVLPTRRDPARSMDSEAAQQHPAASSSLASMVVMIMFSLILIVWIFAGPV